MVLTFREEVATQAAAHLLRRSGGTLPYIKLLKLLYLADRKALLELGRPITFDRYVCMQHGPVLSRTYDLMVAEQAPGERSYWREHISEPRVRADFLASARTPNDVAEYCRARFTSGGSLA